jgi:shikimate kinase
MNVYLVGFRGVGKSTLAPILATRLHRRWIDLDVEAERRAGKPIRAVFAEQGEPAFRDLESAILADVSGQDDWVAATGGGAVLREANRAALRTGFCVWLQADLELLIERLERDRTRPRLTDLPLREEVAALLTEREPLYRQCAHLIADARVSVDMLADRIAQEYRGLPPSW